jgi:RNA polymerase sigma factor (sigma-70 family)
MDLELLDGLRAGRRDALERIYWQHRGAIETLVQVRLGRSRQFSSADRADLVQDVFAKAFSSKARVAYDGERDYGPFLRQLARNTLIDWLRTRRREAAHVDIEAWHESGHPSSALEAEPFPADLVALTGRFVSRLTPELRGVLEQRFVSAESQERAAELLGISRQTLRTLERRLLDGLRREIRRAELAQRGCTMRPRQVTARTD